MPGGETSARAVARGVGADAVKQSPVAPGKEQESSPAASEHMLPHVCVGFELLPVASEQIPLAVSDGSEPPPVASEQMRGV